jgi:transcription elongation GreA/GreB family factor
MKVKLGKEDALKGLIEKFKAEHSSLIQSAKAAHQAATHEESKAEDRHDTFAIEASYLAAGQAARVEELNRTILEFETYLTGTARTEAISIGSLIIFDCDGETNYAFLAHHGGGTKLQINGASVQVISPTSPLGDELFGRIKDEEFEIELRGQLKPYKIIDIS